MNEFLRRGRRNDGWIVDLVGLGVYLGWFMSLCTKESGDGLLDFVLFFLLLALAWSRKVQRVA